MKYIAILFLSLFLCACSDDNLDSGSTMGPCFIDVRDSVVNIVAASGINSGDPIGIVEISDITLDGNPVEVIQLDQEISQNITFNSIENTISCEIPCGFSTQEGSYSFKANAPGYESQVFNVEASYSVFVGGCPGVYDVGTEAQILLQESS